jgi:hypothetical protein
MHVCVPIAGGRLNGQSICRDMCELVSLRTSLRSRRYIHSRPVQIPRKSPSHASVVLRSGVEICSRGIKGLVGMIQPTFLTLRRRASTLSQKYRAKAVFLAKISLSIHLSLEMPHGEPHSLKHKHQSDKLRWWQTTSSREIYRNPDTTVPQLFRHLYLVSMISWIRVMLSLLWTCPALTLTLTSATLLASSTELACV